MNKTTISELVIIFLLLFGIIMASAEPLGWMQPVGLLVMFEGYCLYLHTKKGKA